MNGIQVVQYGKQPAAPATVQFGKQGIAQGYSSPAPAVAHDDTPAEESDGDE